MGNSLSTPTPLLPPLPRITVKSFNNTNSSYFAESQLSSGHLLVTVETVHSTFSIKVPTIFAGKSFETDPGLDCDAEFWGTIDAFDRNNDIPEYLKYQVLEKIWSLRKFYSLSPNLQPILPMLTFTSPSHMKVFYSNPSPNLRSFFKRLPILPKDQWNEIQKTRTLFEWISIYL